jgi:hypothetical protein
MFFALVAIQNKLVPVFCMKGYGELETEFQALTSVLYS